MSIANDPLVRLQQHAGIPVQGGEVPRDTLAEFIFQVERKGSSLDLGVITTDIIQCLDMLNRQPNGTHVHEAWGVRLDRSLVYAASGIVWACLDKAMELRRDDLHSQVANDLLVVAWYVQCAWDALVAGDIDDLRVHVALEKEARVGKGFI